MEKRVDGDALRRVMRHVPSPVTIVTVGGTTEIRGITIGSFTSASLRPPLVTFNVSKDAQIYDDLMAAERFAVHLISDAHAHLSEQFATPDLTSEEQFKDVPYRLDPHGVPVLLDAMAVMHCVKHAVHDAGDHTIVVGRVVELEQIEGGLPILYFDRTYRSVGDEVQPAIFEPVGRETQSHPEE